MNTRLKIICSLCVVAQMAAASSVALAEAPTISPVAPVPPPADTAVEAPGAASSAPLAPTPALPKAATRGGRASAGYGAATGGGYGVAGAGSYGGGAGLINDLPVVGASAVFRSSSRRDAIPPVVLDFSNSDPVARQELEEDLVVMNHIFDQALERGLGEEAPASKMGVPLLYTGGGRAARAIYLDGFGALFMIKVNMPLLAPPAPAPEKPGKPVDSEWESARREVLGSEERGEVVGTGAWASETPFDPEQVEALKRGLIGALKNASNIRRLKSDESVSVAVFGSPAPMALPVSASSNLNFDYRTHNDQPADEVSGSKAKSAKSKKPATASNRVSSVTFSPDGNTSKGTVLTLRVKKADVAQLAEGHITFDEFAKRVTTQAYQGNGNGVSSVNSWIQSGRSGR